MVSVRLTAVNKRLRGRLIRAPAAWREAATVRASPFETPAFGGLLRVRGGAALYGSKHVACRARSAMSPQRVDKVLHRSPLQTLMVRSRAAASRTMRPGRAGPSPFTNGCLLADMRHPLPRRLAPGAFASDPPSKEEGAGKAGRWPRPWPACSKKAGGSHHRSGRERPAFPARRLERLIRGLPGAPGLLATIPSAMRRHCTALIPASGYQDRTTSPCATNRSSARP